MTQPLVSALCSPSALELPAAKESSLTTLPASFPAKWFKCIGTSKWNQMFHFNRSLEGDFSTNDMGRCDGGLPGPRVNSSAWEDRNRWGEVVWGGGVAQTEICFSKMTQLHNTWKYKWWLCYFGSQHNLQEHRANSSSAHQHTVPPLVLTGLDLLEIPF